MNDSQLLPSRVKYWLSKAKHDCFFNLGFESGPKEKIGAIRQILMGCSKPFRAMLDGEMAEKGDIPVNDVEPETFRIFLKCIYGASHLLIPKLTFEEKAKLLYVYEKYLVDDFKNELIEDMKKSLNSGLLYFFVAICHPVCHITPQLNRKMTEIVIFNIEGLISDDGFLEINKSGIKWILQLDYIPIEEIELWHAVLKWAKFQTDSVEGNELVLRLYIFDLLKYIRFLTMKNNEFWDSVVSSGILNKEEISAICRSFVSSKPHEIEYLSTTTRNRYELYPPSQCMKSCFNEHPQYLCEPNSAHLYVSITLTNLELEKRHYSQCHPWAGSFWTLSVERYELEQNDYLEVLVNCDKPKRCEVEISLINQWEKQTYTFDNIVLRFTANCAGDKQFYKWKCLLNEDKGFFNDKIGIVVLLKCNKLDQAGPDD